MMSFPLPPPTAPAVPPAPTWHQHLTHNQWMRRLLLLVADSADLPAEEYDDADDDATMMQLHRQQPPPQQDDAETEITVDPGDGVTYRRSSQWFDDDRRRLDTTVSDAAADDGEPTIEALVITRYADRTASPPTAGSRRYGVLRNRYAHGNFGDQCTVFMEFPHPGDADTVLRFGIFMNAGKQRRGRCNNRFGLQMLAVPASLLRSAFGGDDDHAAAAAAAADDDTPPLPSPPTPSNAMLCKRAALHQQIPYHQWVFVLSSTPVLEELRSEVQEWHQRMRQRLMLNRREVDDDAVHAQRRRMAIAKWNAENDDDADNGGGGDQTGSNARAITTTSDEITETEAVKLQQQQQQQQQQQMTIAVAAAAPAAAATAADDNDTDRHRRRRAQIEQLLADKVDRMHRQPCEAAVVGNSDTAPATAQPAFSSMMCTSNLPLWKSLTQLLSNLHRYGSSSRAAAALVEDDQQQQQQRVAIPMMDAWRDTQRQRYYMVMMPCQQTVGDYVAANRQRPDRIRRIAAAGEQVATILDRQLHLLHGNLGPDSMVIVEGHGQQQQQQPHQQQTTAKPSRHLFCIDWQHHVQYPLDEWTTPEWRQARPRLTLGWTGITNGYPATLGTGDDDCINTKQWRAAFTELLRKLKINDNACGFGGYDLAALQRDLRPR